MLLHRQALAGSVGAGAREGAAWAADQISQEAGGAEPFAAAGACPALLGLVRSGAPLAVRPLTLPSAWPLCQPFQHLR